MAYVGGFEESNRIINELKGFSQNPDCLYVKALGQYYKVTFLNSLLLMFYLTSPRMGEVERPRVMALTRAIFIYHQVIDK